jgi:hypothetical protein
MTGLAGHDARHNRGIRGRTAAPWPTWQSSGRDTFRTHRASARARIQAVCFPPASRGVLFVSCRPWWSVGGAVVVSDAGALVLVALVWLAAITVVIVLYSNTRR